MAAAPTTRVSLLLSLTVLSALAAPSYALTCASKKFSNNMIYATCSDLPQLGAQLHYTYDAANSSLSIAFTAAPAPGGAWVSWAINPTSTGMIGSQALMALKLADGSVVAKTFAVASYGSVVESKLSFDVWDLAAEASEGTMTVLASLKVPENAASVNQVWQIGGKVDGTGHPSVHPMQSANKQSSSTLKLAISSGNGISTVAPAPLASSSSGKADAPSPTSSGAVPMFHPSSLGLLSGLTVLIGSFILS